MIPFELWSGGRKLLLAREEGGGINPFPFHSRNCSDSKADVITRFTNIMFFVSLIEDC